MDGIYCGECGRYTCDHLSLLKSNPVDLVYGCLKDSDDIEENIKALNKEAKKDDSGKPETIYFYWLGLYALTLDQKYLLVHNLIKALTLEQSGNALVNLSMLIDQYKETTNLVDVSLISKFGAKKYGLENYRNGFPWSRLVNSLGRHILKEIKGEPDPDTGQPHALHTLANIFMLADHIKNNLGHNDIPKLLGGK